jgi:predicted nucleotide-binding protein (sugar kinase/HSP70/actin superfamily)
LEYYSSSLEKLKQILKKELRISKDVCVILLGRPYTVLSKYMNNKIPTIFGKLGIKTFYQDMLDYTEGDLREVAPLLNAFHWHYATKILEASHIVSKYDNVYPVLVTSFKCTPDSFVIEYFKSIFNSKNKPYLILQLDEHDSSVGYETRIEAAVRAFRNHYLAQKQKPTITESYSMPQFLFGKKSLKDKTLLVPSWDALACNVLIAAIRSEGIDAHTLVENTESIKKSLSLNTGQCIPLTAIAQNTIETIKKYNLDPAKTAIWNMDSIISCNIRIFPYYLKKILDSYGGGMEKVSMYIGNVLFFDLSIIMAINAYFAYMFTGYLRKFACKIRPYETVKGSTDKAVEKSMEILIDTFEDKKSKVDALKKIAELFTAIEKKITPRPKVAIFGDLYARDNDILNQNLIPVIEENGGEVVTTPYSEFLKIISLPYMKKWLKEGFYSDYTIGKILQQIIPRLERWYRKYLDMIMPEPEYELSRPAEEILAKLNVNGDLTGESMENILKVFTLIEKYPDLSLFVQTNPSYCCPSLVTEAMTDRLYKLTGVPIVSIEYDGTGGFKNDDIIPYLKYPRTARKNIFEEASKA